MPCQSGCSLSSLYLVLVTVYRITHRANRPRGRAGTRGIPDRRPSLPLPQRYTCCAGDRNEPSGRRVARDDPAHAILSDATVRLANGEKADAVKKRTYAAVRQALAYILKGTAGPDTGRVRPDTEVRGVEAGQEHNVGAEGPSELAWSSSSNGRSRTRRFASCKDDGAGSIGIWGAGTRLAFGGVMSVSAATDFLGGIVVAYAKAHPGDTRIPEAQYRVRTVTAHVR